MTPRAGPQSPNPTTLAGAYGLLIEGLVADDVLSVTEVIRWPFVTVGQRVGRTAASHFEINARNAVFRSPGGELFVDRDRSVAEFVFPDPVPTDTLLHPHLATVGSIFAQWRGDLTLHAGAFAAGDGAWALLGDNEAGKSTLLAQLAVAGHPVLSDDTVVISQGEACAGPRCIDLRPTSAERLDLAASSHARACTRVRMPLPPIAGQAPLRGFIFLAWGDGPRVIRLTVRERLERLAAARTLLRASAEPGLLDAAALPGYVLCRPRRWSDSRLTIAALSQIIAG